jgi:hypothetical protein
MRKLYWSMVFGACVMLASAPAAYAGKDYCYDAAGFGIVAKNHKLPKAGKCSKSFDGFFGTQMVTGTACMNSAGTTIRVGYTIAPTGTYVEIGQMNIPFPALAGGTTNYCGLAGSSWFCSSGSASVALCNPLSIPIPLDGEGGGGR